MTGKFIVLEGIDGCGKNTQQDLLENHFNSLSFGEGRGEARDFVYVRVLDEHKEKTKRIREIIFNKDFRYVTESEIMLFYADKFEMMTEIGVALESGKNVICERFELSQYAYQIYGKQREDLRELSDFLTEELQKNHKPDLYIFYDISPTESQKRKHARTSETGKFEDYYDNAKVDFMERVIHGYKTEIKNFNHVVINAEQSKEDVFFETLKAIENVIN